MKVRLGMLCCLFPFLAFAGPEECTRDELYAREINAVRGALNVGLDGVVIMEVFGEYIALPNRYFVVSRTEGETIFSSHYLSLKGVSYLGCEIKAFPRGGLRIGDRKYCEECEPDYFSKHGIPDTSKSWISESGLHVKVISIDVGDGQQAIYAVKYNDSEYISIYDNNPALWDEVFRKIEEQRAK